MPELPTSLSQSCDARYIRNCRACGLSLSDLQLLSYRQVMDLLELECFYTDASDHYEEDKKARAAEAAFWG